MIKGVIQDWSVCVSDPFQPPETRRKCLQGKLGNKYITTNYIDTAKGRLVTTLSGSVYKLGRISKDYRKWLKKNNLNYDPKDPIKFRE